MVRNMRIKNLLISSFVIVLVLMNVLGFMAIFFNQRLANQTIRFYEKPHTIQIQVAEIKGILSELDSRIKEAMIYQTRERTAATTQAVDTSLHNMNGRIEIVKKLYIGDRFLLDTADQKMAVWLEKIDSLRGLMEAERYEEALSLFEADYMTAEKDIMSAVQAISDASQKETEQYYESAKRSKAISTTVILTTNVLTILLTVGLCTVLVRGITVPLKKIKNAADAMSRGDLKQKLDYEGNNEFGQLAASMKTMKTILSGYVNDIDNVLDKIASHDLNVRVEADYIGDFEPIKASMNDIISSLKTMVLKIRESAEQVENGSGQVSGSSQILSQGASEQTASMNDLTDNLTNISSQVEESTKNTEFANQLVATVGARLEKGNKQMEQMLVAMSGINESADQIAKIIKTIEDIAFQTNILALNAAVEAARAGSAGKGFAVVADEVRSLAAKSGEAAKNTTVLIQNAVDAVGNGVTIASETAETLRSVVEGAQQITEMVSRIAASSEEEAKSIQGITLGVQELNQVIQTNSATAEETASSSEELNAQADLLKRMVYEFRIGGGE